MNTTEKIQTLEWQLKKHYKFQAKNWGTPVAITTQSFINQIRAELKELKGEI